MVLCPKFVQVVFYHIVRQKNSVFIYKFGFLRYNVVKEIFNRKVESFGELMPQDAFTLRLIAKELNATLRGGHINKVNQPDKEEVSFVIYTGKRSLKLVLNVNAATCGAYFTEEQRENPLTAPGFCMLLRKHLLGAEILEVDTPGFERILRFRLNCTSDFTSCERVLYAEIMGKYSNLILTENGTILGALKTTSLDVSTKRMIFTGAKYALPAPQDKADPSDLAALEKVIAPSDMGGGNSLFLRVAGLAPVTAEQIVLCYRGGNAARHVHDYIFSDELSPRVIERDGEAVDFLARGSEGIPFETLSAAQSYFYTKKRSKKSEEGLRKKLLSAIRSAIKKHEKRLALTLEKRLSCADMEDNRIRGELITANLWRLERGMKGCELPNYYDEAGGTMKIVLDARLSPADNAQAYFKKYRKQKRTLEALDPQEQETRAELEYLKSLQAAAEAAREESDLLCVEEELLSAGLLAAPKEKKRRQKAEIPFRTYERGGIQIVAGRNNLQNDRLVRQSAPEDKWLHAQRYHSCHVVIKSGGKKVPEDVLQFAADVCALYSDGGGDKIPVDYCPVKNVKKPRGSKAGFVIYNDFKTLLGDPGRV